MPQTHRSGWRALRFLCVLTLAGAPLGAHALGLGRLVVNSGLDEPLNGQIELISPTATEIRTLKTSLASREDFDIAGVERNALLFDITYSVIQQPNGQYYIKVATHQPVREPFIHFLVQVEWSGGRLIREYSALLDPPQWVAGKPADINVPDSGPVDVVTDTPKDALKTAATEPAPAAPVPEETLPPIGTPDPSLATPEVLPADSSGPAGEAVASAPPASPPTEAVLEPVPAAPEAKVEPVAPPAEVASQPAANAPAEPAATVPAGTTPAAPESSPVPQVAAGSDRTGAPAAAPVVASASQYGPVKKGETLYQISKNLNVDKSVTPQQIMLALLRANPSAFFGKNVNNLKVGKILDVPDAETITAIPKAEATKEYSAQYDAWQEYKLKMAGASRAVAVAEPAETPTKPAAEPKQPEAKKDKGAKKAEKTAKAEKATSDKAASGKAVPTDLLKIVRANLDQESADDSTKTPGVETKKDAKEQRALNERVATLEEAIESKQMQNKEMRERVGKLQEQVKNTERLVELENKDLAAAQKQAAEKQAAEAKAAADKAAQEAADKKAAAEKANQEKAAQEKAAADAAANSAPSVKPAENPAPVAKKPALVKSAVPPRFEESFLDSVMASISDNPLILALLAALGVLAVGVGGMYAYRRRRAAREFTESILSSNSLGEASLSDTNSQAAASDTSFLSDFSQGGMGNIHTDEVDPIAEAEVYLAYGRDEQAEEILKDAIVKDPVRQELKGKLLEIYFQRNDVAGFETLAEELYAALEGKPSKVWEKAEEMGRKLSPNNPMFRGGKPAAHAAAAPTTVIAPESSDNGMLSTQSLEFEQSSEPTTSNTSSGLDFNLDFNNTPDKPADSGLDMNFVMDMAETSTAQKASGLDMDFSMPDPQPETDSSSNLIDFSAPSTTVIESESLDFSAADNNTATENEIDFSSESSGTEDVGAGALPGWDETATKLDLAKAYIDMGDSEGARSILDEVMAEGNDNQKRQAQDLAAQIAA